MSFVTGCVHRVKSQGISAQNEKFSIQVPRAGAITKTTVTWRHTVTQHLTEVYSGDALPPSPLTAKKLISLEAN